MSIAGILASSFMSPFTSSVQSNRQQFTQEFQQLGQDLQSGNLSAAQSDFSSLQQLVPSSPSSSTQSSNPISQEFSQLSSDLQAGNLTAAQQDYATIQQDFQSQGSQMHHHHHHHHGGGSSGTTNPLSQLMSELGQSLQSGNLTAAQQAYAALQQDFSQFAQNGAIAAESSSQSTAATSSGVSVNA